MLFRVVLYYMVGTSALLVFLFSFIKFMDLSVYNHKSVGSNYDQRGKLDKEKNHFVEFRKAKRGSIPA